jgi:hypothetical protein
MHRPIRWLAIGGLATGTLAALGCGNDTPDGVGGGATTSSKASTSTTMGTSATTMPSGSNASTSTGNVGPCVLDSSNFDECTLQ